MANLTYDERVALEQQKEALRRQRDDERRNGVAGVRANDSRISGNFDAMHGRAGRKWLGGESGAVSSGDALHGMAGRKWLGGGGELQPQSPFRVTAFGTTGNGDATWYDNMDPIGARARTAAWEAERALRNRAYADQRSSFDEMAQVMDVSKRKKAQRQISLANDIAAMMKFSNGGVIPNELRDLVNRRYGWDGVKTGILPQSGFTVDGSFNILIGNGDDGMGNVATQTQSFNPLQQYQIMNVNQAAFDDNDRGALRQRLINSGYSEKELGVFEQQGANWRRDLAEQKKKLMAMQNGMKDQLSGLKMLQDFVTNEGANLSEDDLAALKGAIAAGMKNLASRYMPQQPQPGVNVPQLSEDGSTLKLPNGVTLQKDQEYTNPQDGKKYIWRGGDAKNFEAIGANGQQQGRQPQKPLTDLEKGKLNNDAFDALNPEGMPGRDAKLVAQGGYLVEDPSQIEGVGPRISNLPEGQDPGATVEPPATPGKRWTFGDYQKGRVSYRDYMRQRPGATGTAGGVAPAGGDGNQKMFDSLKRQGAIDKDLTFEQFCEMLKDEQPEENPPPAE